MDDLTLKIDTGAPVEVPAFEPDECGHNWLAVIEDRDPRAPGGLSSQRSDYDSAPAMDAVPCAYLR